MDGFIILMKAGSYTYNEFSIRLLVIMRAEKNERDVTEPKLRVVTFFVESQISQKIRSMISFDDLVN